MNTIGDRVKELRKNECFMTQAQFAKHLGVTNAHISKIEKGLTVPSEALIKLICKSFNVSEYWLKDGITPMYRYQIEDEAEKNLDFTTFKYNTLLLDKNPLVRLTASQLQMTFTNITNSDNIHEDEKLQYLRTILQLLKHINETIEMFKQCHENKNMQLSENDTEELLKFSVRNIELEMREIMMFWIEE